MIEKTNKYPAMTIVVAIDEQNGIGKDNQLLCHLSSDLKRFKEITTGHTIVMGKNTYLSLPKRPLPNRKHIVLSKSIIVEHEDVCVVESIEDAIKMMDQENENYIIGGGVIYNEFMKYVQKLLITKIYAGFDADVFFPNISEDEWKLTLRSGKIYDEKSAVFYEYLTYERK